jgi:small conductance mechanosensitive channel
MLTDLSHWARGKGLEIVLITIGALLIGRFVRVVAARMAKRLQDRSNRQGPDAPPDEEIRHLRAVNQVVSWVVIVLVYFVASILVIDRFGIPLASLVAPATVAGVAIGFGAQRMVQDLLSGFFLLVERQYAYGDVVRIAMPGQTTGITGTVEELTLRATKLRTFEGELVILPNGEIRQVTNLSRDWARAIVDLPIAVDADMGRVNDVLHSASREFYADKSWRRFLLDEPSVMGIERVNVGYLQVRVVARTQPGKQADVARELRARVTAALAADGVGIAMLPVGFGANGGTV